MIPSQMSVLNRTNPVDDSTVGVGVEKETGVAGRCAAIPRWPGRHFLTSRLRTDAVSPATSVDVVAIGAHDRMRCGHCRVFTGGGAFGEQLIDPITDEVAKPREQITTPQAHRDGRH